MSTFDDIGTAAASASKAVADALGIDITFSARSAAGVILRAILIDDSSAEVEVDGRIEIERMLTLEIPTQTGFVKATDGAEPIIPGDTITFLSRIYSVIAPIVTEGNRTVYIVRCVHHKALSKGVA